jgi:4'-phosphopantetheinyl transferase
MRSEGLPGAGRAGLPTVPRACVGARGGQHLVWNQVHVWQASLDLDPWQVGLATQWLSRQEEQRAVRVRSGVQRVRAVAARAILRKLLSEYVSIEPAELRFHRGVQGKPQLSNLAAGRLQFSVSHCEGVALFAMGFRRVGVDIERVRTGFPVGDITRRFLSAGEAAALEALPESRQAEGFFACWTRKEAYLKARGDGLTTPLRDFEVSVRPNGPARLLADAQDPQGVAQWSMRSWRPEGNHVATVAAEGDDWTLVRRTWTWAGVSSSGGDRMGWGLRRSRCGEAVEAR